MKRIRDWRREFPCAIPRAGRAGRWSGFPPPSDGLWKKHAEDIRRLRRHTTPVFPVFGQEDDPAFAAARAASHHPASAMVFYRKQSSGDGARGRAPING